LTKGNGMFFNCSSLSSFPIISNLNTDILFEEKHTFFDFIFLLFTS